MSSTSSTPRIAVITGASGGIGRAAAVSLARSGWTCVLSGRRQDALDQTVAAMREAVAAGSGSGSGPGSGSGKVDVEVVTGDLTNQADVKRLFGVVKEKYGRVDLLFNNAGISHPATPIEDTPIEAFESVFRINTIAPVMCSQEAVRLMKAQTPQGGRIINNGSISGDRPRPQAAPYSMSKAAITALTKTLAIDGREFNIACSQIDVGNAFTEIGGQGKAVLQPGGNRMVEPNFNVAHVGDAIAYMANLPLDVNILNQTIMATTMPLVGRG